MTGTIGLKAAALTRSRLATRSLSIPTRSRSHSKPRAGCQRRWAPGASSPAQLVLGDPSAGRDDDDALPEVERGEFTIRDTFFIEGAVESHERLVDRLV